MSSYLRDKKKVSSAPNVFKLLAMDFFETEGAIRNIAAHPSNRVALARGRGEDGYTLVFNIMVPGPPFYSFVAYWSMSREAIDADTPFGRLAR